jgi:predicted nucleic acid-binding protein
MSGPLVLLDTSILVGAKNPDEAQHDNCARVLELAHGGRVTALVSVVSVAELSVGYLLEDDPSGLQAFLDYLRSSTRVSVVDIGLRVASLAAEIRAETGLRLPDALVVASGLARNAELVVTEDREFRKSRKRLAMSSAREVVARTNSG